MNILSQEILMRELDHLRGRKKRNFHPVVGNYNLELLLLTLIQLHKQLGVSKSKL